MENQGASFEIRNWLRGVTYLVRPLAVACLPLGADLGLAHNLEFELGL
jgi:hypothetical protein